MSGRHTDIMKVHILVPFAIISLLIALPLTTTAKGIKGKTYAQSASKTVTIKLASHKVTPQQSSQPATPPTTPQPITPAAPVAAPATVATPPPQVITASYTCQNYATDFKQYNWNPSVAMAICQAESSGSPTAVGCANYDNICDYGLMQLHGIDILDPASNIAYAYYHKYLTQGWGAWSTYSSGAYLKYL